MENKIKRSKAAKILEEIRQILANSKPTEENTVLADFIDRLEEVLTDNGIPPLTKCNGEAHSTNPYAVNCGICAPRWGLVGPFIKIT